MIIWIDVFTLHRGCWISELIHPSCPQSSTKCHGALVECNGHPGLVFLQSIASEANRHNIEESFPESLSIGSL